MHLSEIVRAMADAGATAKQIADVVEKFEQARIAAQRLDVPPAEWHRLRGEVMRRDGHTCAYCGVLADKTHIDHVVPRSVGGKSTLENLVVACESCNSSKRASDVDEWMARR